MPVTVDDAGGRTYGEATFTVGSGKLSVFDAATYSRLADHSFLGLSRNDGSGSDNTPFSTDPAVLDAANVNAQGVISQTSMRTTFSPYGVAVDGTTPGGATLITTTARGQNGFAGYNYGGNIVLYSASQGAPTDADRIYTYGDEANTPVFDGPRRIAVDSTRHLAYVTNLGTGRGNQTGADARAGYVTVLDLTKRGLDAMVAQVALPMVDDQAVGVIDLTVDEANNLVYVGTIGAKAGTLYVIDGSKVVTSNPRTTSKAQSQAQNAASVTHLPEAAVGNNARPAYSAELKRLYVSAYATQGTITVVDADPASAGYGKVVETIDTGATNAVEVDGQRGLLYSANLGDKEVVVYSTATHEELLRVPTSGNAVNLAIDPVTRDVWVSNFSSVGKVDVITLTSGQVEPVDPEPTTPPAATVKLPADWKVGQPLTVSGSGWLTRDGAKGSTIAVKLDRGGTALNDPIGGDVPDDVWTVIEANDDGTWTAELKFPGASLTSPAWLASSNHTVSFLTGTLDPNDPARGQTYEIPVVGDGDGEPTAEPTDTPTAGPTDTPTGEPTATPSATRSATVKPTAAPSQGGSSARPGLPKSGA